MTKQQKERHFCLSKEEVKSAWNDQHNGDTLVKVSLKYHCGISTLYRGYRIYGLGTPVRKKAQKKGPRIF